MVSLALLTASLASPGMDALSAGDEARWAGDRVEARRQYKLAVEAGEPAVEAMARLRLLHFSGNLGMLVHGPKAENILFTAEPDAALALAWADYHLLAPAQLGTSLDDAVDLAGAAYPELPAPALARLYLATGEQRYLDELAATDPKDGLGRALIEHEGAPAPDPGTWFFSLGLAGAPGAGFGGGVSLIHPDWLLRDWKLQAGVFATTRGTAVGTLSLRSPGRVFGTGAFVGARTVADLYDSQGRRSTFEHERLVLRLGGGVTHERLRVTAGPQGRADRADISQPDLSLGPWASAVLDQASGWGRERRGWILSGSTSGAFGQHTESLQLSATAVGYLGLLKGVTAGRLTVDHELLDAPVYLLPSAGGADLHRGAWASRYRSPSIATADLEQRWVLIGPLEAAIFVDGAWILEDGLEGLHPGGGGGIRLILPPEAYNVLRVDVAVSDSGWGVYTGWGETF